MVMAKATPAGRKSPAQPVPKPGGKAGLPMAERYLPGRSGPWASVFTL